MIDAGLRASLIGFDDDALATLANRGLVRRARRDLDEGKVRLVSTDGNGAVIEADGERVALDRRGPKAATCTCRSVAICRHRIAAVIFALAQVDGHQGAVDEPASDPADLLGEIDLGRLERWAGKAGWLAAFDLAAAAGQVDTTANAIVVAFPDIEGPVRILRGQGIEGITSKASKPRIKAYHAAAVLAARRHCALTLPDPPTVEIASARDVEVDPGFLSRVDAALSEVAMSGFNLAPLPLEELLFSLSVSSRADSLPRLAAMLRAIAAQMRRRRTRALDFDPDRLLELGATAHALVRALGHADPDRRLLLAGKVRRDFSPSAPLELVGCGGEQWRSPSGARGVTAWFVEMATGRWLSATLARGAGQDPFFAPADAWRQQPLWQAGPLATLAHAGLRLEGARESADGRLSAPAGARATLMTTGVAPDPAWPGVVREWDQLRDRWHHQTGLGLDHADAPAAALIAPARTALPFFDDLAQQLVWPVLDRAGQWLALTIDHDDTGSTAIEALEANVRSDWRGLMLVRLARAGDRLTVQPLTLFGAGDPIDLTLWSRPSRPGEGKSSVRDWLARLRPGGSHRFSNVPRTGTDAALAAAWRHLLDRAEMGPALALTLDPQLEEHAGRLEGYGFARLAALLRAARDGEALLAAGYALLLARRQRCAPPLLR